MYMTIYRYYYTDTNILKEHSVMSIVLYGTFLSSFIIKESTESADPGLVAKVSQPVVSFPDYHIAWE